jgi:hypothetical protein
MQEQKKYSDAKAVKLEDYFPPDRFRLIKTSQISSPGGYSEYAVEIQITRAFARTLGFITPWGEILYGFVGGSRLLENSLDKLSDGAGRGRVYLKESGDKFLMFLLSGDGKKESVFSVASAEVRTALNDCLKPAEFAKIIPVD